MVKNKWLNALIFVGIGVVIGLGIGMSATRRVVSRTVSSAPVPVPEIIELEDIEEFEGEGLYFYQYGGGQSWQHHRSSGADRDGARRIVIEQAYPYPAYPTRAMPFMTRRPFGFGLGRGVLALGLIGLGIALVLMRRKNKPPAPVVGEAPPPPDEDK